MKYVEKNNNILILTISKFSLCIFQGFFVVVVTEMKLQSFGSLNQNEVTDVMLSTS